ncbi:MAG: T9SS type A sorting domain-containing protein [Ignavibacteriae bacterium]|nr:T9SS type A sorting domain-containing protein [Ignavibacteriota bacterium]
MNYRTLLLWLVFAVLSIHTLALASNDSRKNQVHPKRLENEGPDAKTTTTIPPDEVQAFRETGSPAAELEQERARIRKFLPEQIPLTLSDKPAIPMSLSGDYTVGAGQPFHTLHEVISVLNYATITGPTRFLFTDANYIEPSGLSLGAINGSSSTNTITFQPASATSGVSITVTNNNSYGGGWVFTGVQYLTIEGTKEGGAPGSRDLSIAFESSQPQPSSSYNGTMRFYDGSSQVNIQNCVVKGQLHSAGGQPAISLWQNSITAVPLTYFTINNCEITEASTAFGVYSFISNTGLYESPLMKNISVTNNWIHDVQDFGIYYFGVADGNIKNNIIENVTTPETTSDVRTSGMHLVGAFRLNIENNKIVNIVNLRTGTSSRNRTYGIRILGPAGLGDVFNPTDEFVESWSGYLTKNRIMQNTIVNIESQSNTYIAMVGFSTEGTRHDTAAHNSIHMAGADMQGGVVAIYTYGTTLATSRLRCYNNIASVTRGTTDTANLNTVIRSSDLAGADYRSPSNNNVYYNPTPGGVIFADAGYTTTYEICAGRGVDCNSVSGDPRFISATDLHIDNSAYTPASNIGKPYPQVPNDLHGIARDAITPDAGAYEFNDAPSATDVAAISIDFRYTPDILQGIPFNLWSFDRTIQNTNQFPVTGVTAIMRVLNPSSVEVFTETVAGINLPAFEAYSVTFTGTFTPADIGVHTFELSVTAAGDINANNDTVRVVSSVVGQIAIPYSTDFNDAGDADGWVGTGDFVLDSTFTKLGGPRGGSGSAWVTVPGPPGTQYHTGQGNYLYSPYFNFSSITQGYISFFQSIKTEPDYDYSVMQYSIDTGKTWLILGVLNDPNGINWYNEFVYNNASMENSCFGDWGGDCFYWPGFCTGSRWTSNGDCNVGVPTGPYGYVYVQYNLSVLPQDDSPLGKSYVRFRYVALADWAENYDGWAIDDFRLSPTVVDPLISTITGKKFHDSDGDGIFNDLDTLEAGVKINLAYFGSNIMQDTTDTNGMYSFNNLYIPGTYTVSVDNDSVSLTLPATGKYDFELTGTGGIFSGNDFGNFYGSVSGKIVKDDNRNGVDDGESGYSGFVVEAHKDSCTGPIIFRGSVVSDANGMYFIPLPPGTYYITVEENSDYETIGTTCRTVTISGLGGSNSANISGVNFYEWGYGIILIGALGDLNGNGIQDDLPPLPPIEPLPIGIYFEVYKNGVLTFKDTLGNGTTIEVVHGNLSPGEYVIIQTNIPVGWRITNGTLPDTIVINNSGEYHSKVNLHFRDVKANGIAYHDMNGNGAKDSSETGMAGVIVSVNGNSGGTDTSDVNGFYEFFVGPGNHVITEIPPTGFIQTGVSSYSFTALSGRNHPNKNFGNWEMYDISGSVYRDEKGNGTRERYDFPFAGVTVSLSGTGGGETITSTDGEFSFNNVGAGNRILSVMVPSGFTTSMPVTGTYTITTTSGQDVTNKDFGLFLTCDGCTWQYRTFTKDSLEAWAFLKPIQRGKGFPNIQNMYDEMVTQAKAETTALGVLVGKANQFLPSMNMKGYVQPTKRFDINTTLAKKRKTELLYHSGTPRGLDFFTGSEKRILKMNKSLGADKHNNTLLANLLTLSINSRASYFGKTPVGFGDLIYVGSRESWFNMTVDEILESAGEMMTNWEFHPRNSFEELNMAVEEMNAEFSGPLDTNNFIIGKKLSWRGVKNIESSYIFIANPSPKPRTKLPYMETVEPKTFFLAQNYPNPFNPVTTLQFDLNEPALVTLTVYNMLGQEIATLVEQEEYSDGRWEMSFDATGLTSGVYFYRIALDVPDEETGTVSHTIQTKKMLLAR